MTQKSTKAILSIVLCTCLLSGCSISITPASSSASSTPLSSSENNSDTNSTDTSASAAPSPTPAATDSVDEPVESASGDVLPESTPAQNEQISVFPDNEVQKSDLALYTQTLGRFFHSPMQSTKDIPLDYSLSFFLLYQTFERNGEGSSYTQNSNFFWEIPESDILQTADLYLGLSDLSISNITEWPFGDPQNGMCYYSQETSLPYGDITVTDVTFDTAASKALVFTEAADNQFEDSSKQKSSLVYHFTYTDNSDGNVVYQLESITSQ